MILIYSLFLFKTKQHKKKRKKMERFDHQGKHYVFLMNQNKFPPNKELQQALESLPELIGVQTHLVKICPSKCFFGEYPELTFYQGRVSEAPTFHACTPKERKTCVVKSKEIKEKLLPFRVFWNPYSKSRERLLEE